MTKKVIQITCSLYGSVAFALVVWFCCACILPSAVPENPYIVMSIWAIHGLVICLTLQRFVGRPPYWSPIFVASERNIKRVRLFLTLCLTGCLVSVLFFIFAIMRENNLWESKSIGCVLASMGMLSSAYTALHWAIRPENIFGETFLARIINPFSNFR